MVHYANSDGDVATAADQSDGLAVLGVFFEVQTGQQKLYPHGVLTKKAPVKKKTRSIICSATI